MFKDKENFIKYFKFVGIFFGITWIIMMSYLAFEAPTFADESTGRTYAITYKSRTKFLTLTEEILVCGSTIGAALSFVTLQMMTFSENSKD